MDPITQMQYMMYGFFGWGLVVTAMLITCLMWTPALLFIRARMSKTKAVAVGLGKGARISFFLADYMGGQWKTDKHGVYKESPNSTYWAFRTPIVFVYEYFGHTLPIKYPSIIQAMRKAWYFVTFRDYKKIVETADEKEKIEIDKTETIVVNDLMHMFPANDDPHITEKMEAATIQADRKTREGKGDFKGWIMIIIIAALAGYLIYSFFYGKSPPTNVVCQFPNLVQTAAQNITI